MKYIYSIILIFALNFPVVPAAVDVYWMVTFVNGIGRRQVIEIGASTFEQAVGNFREHNPNAVILKFDLASEIECKAHK